jgi:hypothetical protein
MLTLRNGTLLLTASGLVLLTGALGAGCGGDGIAEYAYPSEAAFCQALAEAQCQPPIVFQCLGSNPDESTLEADTASCIAAASNPAVCNPSRLPYHPEQGEFVLEPVAAIYADGIVTQPELGLLNQELRKVFNNGGLEGMECELPEDCSVGLGVECIIKDGAGDVGRTGICAVPRVVTVGMSCSSPSEACDALTFCYDGKYCVNRPLLNERCDDGFCSAGLECSAQNGVCVQKAPNGSACELGNECSGGFCIKPEGDTITGHCAAQDDFESVSQSCTRFRR